jgi:hypothetical protein
MKLTATGTYTQEGRELHVEGWCKNLKETQSLKNLGTDGKILK